MLIESACVGDFEAIAALMEGCLEILGLRNLLIMYLELAKRSNDLWIVFIFIVAVAATVVI